MICELKRILENPLYWLIQIAGIAVRGVMAYNDMKHRPETYFAVSGEFWRYYGSLTEALLILYVIIHLFSYDTEKNVYPIIGATPRGRISLFYERLLAGLFAVCISTAFMCCVNIILSVIIGAHLTSEAWILKFIFASLTAAVGACGLFLVSACICDLTKNHALTMAACAPIFLMGYVFTDYRHKFDPTWFLKYGFFTDLMRGRTLDSLPIFWAAWYTVMIMGIFALVYKTRKKRLEL